MIVGRFDIGATAYELDSDTKLAARFNLAQAGLLSKGSVYLDGLGAGIGPQVAQLAVYDALNALLAVSDEITVVEGQEPGWVDLAFAVSGLTLEIGDYFIALLGGATANTIQVYGSDPHGMGGKTNADTYTDGPSDPFGSATGLTADFAAFLTISQPWVVPDETDMYYSRLPLAEAQAIFGAGGPQARTKVTSTTTWHSTFQDPETGSNALVRDGGPLMDLIGERIKVSTIGTAVQRSVYAYVHDVFPADRSDSMADLSLTRLLFSRLGALGGGDLDVAIEIVA